MGRLKPYKNIKGHMFRVVSGPNGPVVQDTQNENEALDIVTAKHGRRCPYCNSKQCRFGLNDPVRSEIFWMYEIEGERHQFMLCVCRRHRIYFLFDKSRRRKDKYLKETCSYCPSPAIDRIRIYTLYRKNHLMRFRLSTFKYYPDIIGVDKETCLQCGFERVLIYDLTANRPRKILFDHTWSYISLLRMKLYLKSLSSMYETETKIDTDENIKAIFEISGIRKIII